MRTVTEKALLLSALLLSLPWSAARAETCAQTIQFIQELYNRTVDACPSGEPASSCSGIMLRGTTRADPAKGQSWDVWNPNPQTVAKGASSYSFVRADASFSKLAVQANNGFIITPTEFLCQGQPASYVQCAFPRDGWTWERNDRGCGDNTATPSREDHCQNLGINTGAAWVNDFRGRATAAGNPLRTQCGFDMSRARGQAGRAEAFKDFLDARRLSNASEFQEPNEVMVSNKDAPNILAFFYVDAPGRAEALKNQADYFAKTGEYRPVVRVQLPSTQGAKAQFFCDEQQMAFPGSSRSPGFCRAGRASTPGFGTPSLPVANPAQSAAQAAQIAAAAQAAGQAQPQAANCQQYIASTSWVQRSEIGFANPIWSLQITPTECGRRIGPEQTDRMYAELESKLRADPRWNEKNNPGTLRRQLVCHLVVARDKPTWNIEGDRPYVSYEASLRLPSPCNPVPSDAGK